MTDARVSREHVETLTNVTVDARVSREHVETLTLNTVDARISREHVEVLYGEISPGAVPTWWDGTQRRPAKLRGWWDGTAIQPIKTVDHYVDGAGVSHPLF